MSILTILEYPHPLLKKQCKAVRKFENDLKNLINDMKETMENYNGVGLASSQVGILKRVIVVKDEDKILALVNPKIVRGEIEEISTEGCLSFPQKIAEVKRFYKIKFKAQDEKGKKINQSAEGLVSRIIQHEIDHLNGILLPERAEEGTFREIPSKEEKEEE